MTVPKEKQDCAEPNGFSFKSVRPEEANGRQEEKTQSVSIDVEAAEAARPLKEGAEKARSCVEAGSLSSLDRVFRPEGSKEVLLMKLTLRQRAVSLHFLLA